MLSIRLKSLRKEFGKTQQDVADYLGVTRPAYTAYEIDKRSPDHETLSKLATLYNVSVDYLLGRTDNKNPSDQYEIQTIAAHKEGEEWTEEELKTIEEFKAFVRSQRKNKE
ncbi:helix-turn-helix domain-containing protein [Metasolibacillus meyeri]|uniref:helix-turn-helix domain-containing protein n=1 Tax=Metasolibacillus meyeri TaxID=1071052 RepID=UPI000D31B749|nr:helix-turn-helix transcriptional regulator [Metasolibacillus meyeri]